MKKSLALLGRLTGISPVKDICPVPKSDRDFSIEGVVIEQTELYNKKNESGIDVADLNTGICIMYTENIDNMIMSVKSKQYKYLIQI